AGGSPFLFGGDLNLRPGKQPRIFERLRDEFGLAPTTGPEAIDHILCRGLEVVEPPAQWPPEQRELEVEGRALRLSDHAPVQARFRATSPDALRN
ncbi:MAG TPA: hypothetical protein VNM41_06245, partial [Solirubrobacterales bacterium]|nr:hypothetical protein [Solirubrobacterales bacterium]